MKDKILNKLDEIEKKENIKILYAVESGSRGWGFASKDSDYDIRFIYIHPLNWYLSIIEKRDVIECSSPDQLDISGWDIKKALNLFRHSNPSFYEWLNSPIVYIEKNDFTRKLRALMSKYYSPISSIYHYLHMAKGNYREYLQREKVKVKKYFYVLRPVLACMWIENQKTIPPMEFEKLLYPQKLDKKLRDEINTLLKRKRTGKELDLEDRIDIVNRFLEEKISYFEDYVKTVKSERPKSYQDLDDLFGDTLKTIG